MPCAIGGTSDPEYAQLGTALRLAETANVWPPAIGATRFLALTGWRSGEALGLRWGEVDLVRRTATLPDTKTGKHAPAVQRRVRPQVRPRMPMNRVR